MRRAITAAALSLLAVAVIAPAAQGSQRVRYFQALSLNGSFPGQIYFTVIYQDRHGSGRFTPRWLAGYSVDAQVSCDPGGTSAFSVTKSADKTYGHIKQRLKKGRFATRFEAGWDPQARSPVGDLSGRVTRKGVNGSFNVEDWDPNPGARENCISSGSFLATPCRLQGASFNLPLCRNIAS